MSERASASRAVYVNVYAVSPRTRPPQLRPSTLPFDPNADRRTQGKPRGVREKAQRGRPAESWGVEARLDKTWFAIVPLPEELRLYVRAKGEGTLGTACL